MEQQTEPRYKALPCEHSSPFPCKTCEWERWTKLEYGISYSEVIALQGGEFCRLCGCTEHKKNGKLLRKFCMDHDHITNEVRGLLCTKCNLKVGRIEATIRRSFGPNSAVISYLNSRLKPEEKMTQVHLDFSKYSVILPYLLDHIYDVIKRYGRTSRTYTSVLRDELSITSYSIPFRQLWV